MVSDADRNTDSAASLRSSNELLRHAEALESYASAMSANINPIYAQQDRGIVRRYRAIASNIRDAIAKATGKPVEGTETAEEEGSSSI